MAGPGQKDSSFGAMPAAAKLILLVMLLGVLSGIYYFALHMSLAEDIENAQSRYTQLQGDLQQAQRRQREYLELSQQLANREALDRRNRRVLPEDAEIPAFLQDLNRLAELSGLAIRTVTPRPEETKPHFRRIPVALQLTGSFHQLMKFFYNVSRLERVISMENLVLGNVRTSAEDITLDVEVKAITYRRPATVKGAGKGRGKGKGKGKGKGPGKAPAKRGGGH